MHNNQYSYIDLIQSLTDSQVVSGHLCGKLRETRAIGKPVSSQVAAVRWSNCDRHDRSDADRHSCCHMWFGIVCWAHGNRETRRDVMVKVVDFCLFFWPVKWWWCQAELLKGQKRVDSGGIRHSVDVLFERHVVFLSNQLVEDDQMQIWSFLKQFNKNYAPTHDIRDSKRSNKWKVWHQRCQPRNIWHTVDVRIAAPRDLQNTKPWKKCDEYP